MPTPVARLVGSSEASFTTTVASVPSGSRKDTRWFWLIWPVPIRSVARSSRPEPPSAASSHSSQISSGRRISTERAIAAILSASGRPRQRTS